MKNIKKQLIFCVAMTVAISVGQQLAVHAEGALLPSEAGYGANRRVRTNSGYQGVRGYFTIPTFSIPVEYSNDDPGRPKYNPNLSKYTGDDDADGRPDQLEAYMDGAIASGWTVETSATSNINDSKPTFYLGSSGSGLEVDAHFQWEWLPLYGYAPGWAAAISHNNQYTNARAPQPDGSNGAYRVGPGTPNPTVSKFQMEYTVPADGKAELAIIPKVYNASADYNPEGVRFHWVHPGTLQTQIYTSTQRDTLRVKRVVGITQKGGPGADPDIRAGDAGQLDGSWMRGCIFSEGELQNSAGWQTWTASHTDNATANETGYAPGRYNAAGNVVNNSAGVPINDKDDGDPRRYKVDFPGITSQASLANPELTEEQIRKTTHNQPGDGSRYAYEQVDINLQNGTEVQGAIIRPSWFDGALLPSSG